MQYREPYPTWILVGMDLLAVGILLASFRDAWSVVSQLGGHGQHWANQLVAAAVVLAMDASILLLEQSRSQFKLRDAPTRVLDGWALALILISAMLNVRYLTQNGTLVDQLIGTILGIAIPATIAVLGYVKGEMLAFNARARGESSPVESPVAGGVNLTSGGAARTAPPLFRLQR